MTNEGHQSKRMLHNIVKWTAKGREVFRFTASTNRTMDIIHSATTLKSLPFGDEIPTVNLIFSESMCNITSLSITSGI
ncbi:Hypothetical predicted protein [Octopus vulgaris]|uniref:Uncharacterized protein n=1 Tax=Octopus vulgaris TaxID=6645 RepID=A0AA36BB78_OCTVU|nr:Hypothetical predicted protein [Octopus vulgaris]